jgi:DNA processing protein
MPNTDPIDYDDKREVRLRLGRLIEPEDQLFAQLLDLIQPACLLRAIVEGSALDAPIPEGLAAKFDARRAGLKFRLALADPAADLEAGGQAGARYLIPGDEDWPAALDDLGGRAPLGLWMIGGFPLEPPMVAMVGARACTGYGLQAAGQLAAELAKDGVTIVSGAALGVDGAAHRGALAVGGVTVAVLACGVDRRYPAAHDNLIQAIGERGAVLAELPPGTAPTRFRFLARNRLIAALAAATVVVEAAGRSGSLVTARLAAELGRAVFAVPGPITSRLSLGTNALLCDGAIPALDGEQVQYELGIEPRKPPAAPPPAASAPPPAVPPPAAPPPAAPAPPPATVPAAPPPAIVPGAATPSSLPPSSADALPSSPLPSVPSPTSPPTSSPPLSSPPSPSTSSPPSSAAAPSSSPLPPSPSPPSAPLPSSPPPCPSSSTPSPSPARAPFDRAAILVREALPTVRSGRAMDATALAAETGLTPGAALAALGLLAACGIAVKTGGGWALLSRESG